MSTSVSRRSSSAAHPTRQQLDELDALLKRMLDLPVNRAGDEADGPAPPAPPAPPAKRQTEEPAVNYSTAEEEEADLKPRVVSDAPPDGPQSGRPENWAPPASSWQPSARTWKPLSDAWKQAQAAAGRPAEPPPAADAPALAAAPAPKPAPPKVEAPRPTPPTPAPRPPVPAPKADLPPLKELPPLIVAPVAALWPMVLFNRAFDACLTPWGAPGRWLRGRAGRMLLGAVGLACLTAAAALAAADWFGWTW